MFSQIQFIDSMLPYQPQLQAVLTTIPTTTATLPLTTKTVAKPSSVKLSKPTTTFSPFVKPVTTTVTMITDHKQQSTPSIAPVFDPKWSIRSDIKSRLGDIESIDVTLDEQLVILHSANRPFSSE